MGDHSSYVRDLQQRLTAIATVVGAKLAGLDWEYTCDKLARAFIPRYSDVVFRCRRYGGGVGMWVWVLGCFFGMV